MTKRLELSQGKYATVDDDVYEWASKFKYQALRKGRNWYAARHAGKRPFRKTTYLHREIMNPPNGIDVDHIDGNGLHCTRKNMRFATKAQNARNSRLQANNKSGYKGVHWDKGAGKWRARIRADGNKRIHLGLFTDPIEAARAYDTAARKHHGRFAKTNFSQ